MRSLFLALVFLVLVPVAPASAAVGLPASWDKGFTFTSWWNDHYASATADDSFDQMLATRPNSVGVISTWYTSDLRGSTIAPRADHTPSDAALETIIGKAHAAGLTVFLRPIVDPYGGGWRAEYDPDDPSAWFTSYRQFMYHYADLAERLHVENFAIGAELTSMTVPAYSPHWRSIIAGIRQRYSGKLTYGSVYGDEVDFWDALDYFGIDWYMGLAAATGMGQSTLSPADSNLGVDAIAARWSTFTDEYGITRHYLQWLEDRYRQWGKPIVFNELGYPSNREALVNPFSSYSPTATVDTAVQARAYGAAFRALAGKPWVKGVYVWQWYWNDASIDPATDMDQSPQNKPAEAVIQAWFSATAPEPERTSPTPADPVAAPPPSSPPSSGSVGGVLTSPPVGCRAARPGRTATSLRLTRRPTTRTRVRAIGGVGGACRGSVVLSVSRRQASGRWRTALRQTASVALDGTFAETITLPKGHTWRVQAEFRGTAGAARSRSVARQLRT